MTDTDHYDYSVDLDDDRDVIDFGKWKGFTPSQMLTKKPSYLIWAWENTNKWVGSEDIIRSAYRISGWDFKPRSDATVEAIRYEDDPTEDFDNAILDAYGVSPLRAKHTWEENHK